MSIENDLQKLTAAIEALTAAITANGAAAPAAAPAPAAEKATRTKKDTPAPAAAPAAPAGPTRDEVNAALETVREKKGVDAAKAIIKDAGGVSKRADIPEDKLAAVYEACKKASEEEEGL